MRLALFARALLPVALIAGTACSDDDKSASTKPSVAFCDAADVVAVTGPDDGRFEKLVEAAPETSADALNAFGEAAGKAAEVPDDMGFLTAEFRTAQNNAFAAIAGECDFASVDVSAAEYAFSGLDISESGTTVINMSNAGTEVHELLLYRRGSTTDDDLVAVVNSNPSVDDGRLEEIGVGLPLSAGNDTALMVRLTKGDYVGVCFISKGVTSLDALRSAPEGTPDHRSLGMIKQFSIQ